MLPANAPDPSKISLPQEPLLPSSGNPSDQKATTVTNLNDLSQLVSSPTHALDWMRAKANQTLARELSGSPLLNFIEEIAPEEHLRLALCAPYKRLLSGAALNLQVEVIRTPEQYRDFRIIGEFPDFMASRPAVISLDSWPSFHRFHQLVHDLDHFFMGEFCPYPLKGTDRIEDVSQLGTPWSYEVYHKEQMYSEVHARWFSDAFLPEQLGEAYFEDRTGMPPLSQAFREMGIYGFLNQCAALYEISTHVRLPRQMQQSSKREKFSKTIEYYLMRGRLDAEYTKAQYELWLKLPSVLALMTNFQTGNVGGFCGEIEEFHNRMRTQHTVLFAPIGVNPNIYDPPRI
jgi:hypothetical protein